MLGGRTSRGGLERLVVAQLRVLDTTPVKVRAPVTPDMLRSLRALGAPTAVRTAAVFAFMFFLRPSEYCLSSTRAGWLTKIARVGAVTRQPGSSNIILRVVARKNNPHNYPIDLGSGPATDPDLDPTIAINDMLAAHPYPSDPDAFLFCNPDGTLLRAELLTAWLRKAAVACGRDSSCIAAHSLRVGGATMAYRSGMREMWIMMRGYWLSLAGMMRYCRNFPEDDMWCSDMLGGAFLEKPVAAAVSRRAAAPALSVSRYEERRAALDAAETDSDTD